MLQSWIALKARFDWLVKPLQISLTSFAIYLRATREKTAVKEFRKRLTTRSKSSGLTKLKSKLPPGKFSLEKRINDFQKTSAKGNESQSET